MDSGAFHLLIEEHDQFLLARGSGAATLADFFCGIDQLADRASGSRHTRLLLDLREAQQNLKFTEHLQLGARVAEKLGFAERVATIVPESSRTGSSEKAAQKTGLHLCSFTDFKEAVTWLLEEERPA